jgi:hypothetical protein
LTYANNPPRRPEHRGPEHKGVVVTHKAIARNQNRKQSIAVSKKRRVNKKRPMEFFVVTIFGKLSLKLVKRMISCQSSKCKND